jgi:hypothetical protein
MRETRTSGSVGAAGGNSRGDPTVDRETPMLLPALVIIATPMA